MTGFTGADRDVGVAVSLGGGVELGAGVGFRVGVAVAVGVSVGIGVGDGLKVEIGIAVGLGVGVTLGEETMRLGFAVGGLGDGIEKGIAVRLWESVGAEVGVSVGWGEEVFEDGWVQPAARSMTINKNDNNLLIFDLARLLAGSIPSENAFQNTSLYLLGIIAEMVQLSNS